MNVDVPIIPDTFAPVEMPCAVSDCYASQQNTSNHALFESSYASAVGIDVHNNKMVAVYQKSDSSTNSIEQDILTTQADLDELKRLVDWILDKNPEVITMESTGVYWFNLYQQLEDAGLGSKSHVLNAHAVKVISGRKTDKTDAAHLATVGRLGMFRSSYIPEPLVRETRLLSRHIHTLTHDRSRCSNRMHNKLTALGMKASVAFSDVNGKAARMIIRAALSGMTGETLISFIEENGKRLKLPTEQIFKLVQFRPEKIVAKQLYFNLTTQYDLITSQISELGRMLDNILEPFSAQVSLLMTIPGFNKRTAQVLISELGVDWKSNFPTSHHLASWIGIAPGNKESAGVRYRTGITKGNKYIRNALIEAAHAAAKSKDHRLSGFFKNMCHRRGAKKSKVALGHKLLRIAYAMMASGEPYKMTKPEVPDEDGLFSDESTSSASSSQCYNISAAEATVSADESSVDATEAAGVLVAEAAVSAGESSVDSTEATGVLVAEAAVSADESSVDSTEAAGVLVAEAAVSADESSVDATEAAGVLVAEATVSADESSVNATEAAGVLVAEAAVSADESSVDATQAADGPRVKSDASSVQSSESSINESANAEDAFELSPLFAREDDSAVVISSKMSRTSRRTKSKPKQANNAASGGWNSDLTESSVKDEAPLLV